MIVDCAIYENGVRRDGKVELENAYDERHRPGRFVWIGLYEPTEDEFDSLRREFRLHPLAVEDAIHAHQRPKLEVYDEMVFLVLKTARYVDPTEVIELGEVLVFLGDDFLITVRHGEASSLSPVRERLERESELAARGTGAVLYSIVDRIVDDYEPVVDGLSVDIHEVEEQVFSSGRHNPVERIYYLEREVLDFRRAVQPLAPAVERLATRHFPVVEPDLQPYFRDVHDHLLRVNAQVEQFRELLSSALAANLTQISVRQNEDMRRITAWVAILAVPTAVAGIYGMNFDHMPELRWEYGYPAVLIVILMICLFLYRRFRRAGWL